MESVPFLFLFVVSPPCLFLFRAQLGDDVLDGGDEGGGFGFGNLLATLGLDSVDEGLEDIDSRDIVVLVQVCERIYRGMQLGIQVIFNPLLQIEVDNVLDDIDHLVHGIKESKLLDAMVVVICDVYIAR